MTNKSYHVEFTKNARKQLKKMDKFISQMLYSWVMDTLEGCNDPRSIGKPLVENRKDQWRYRVGDYRILVVIEDEVVTIHIVEVGHRKDVYN